jgi:hypothetical protein
MQSLIIGALSIPWVHQGTEEDVTHPSGQEYKTMIGNPFGLRV